MNPYQLLNQDITRFLDTYSRVGDLDIQFLDCNYTTEASLGGLLSSQASSKDGHLKHVEKDSRDVGREAITSSHLESTLFAQSTIMESFWKKPRSHVQSSTALIILVRLNELLSEASLEALYSIPVIHCPQAFSVVLKASERINSTGKVIPGWKLVYSGDTQPCQALIDASRDVTILIHEGLLGLEKISKKQHVSCLTARVISAVLTYVDFFSTRVLVCALTMVSNICKQMPLDSASLMLDSVPTMCNQL